MASEFTRSLDAGAAGRGCCSNPPPEEDSPLGYVDQDPTILGEIFDIHDQRMRQEFLGQCDFIASQFRELDKKLDERFQRLEKHMDERFQRFEKRFDQLESRWRISKFYLRTLRHSPNMATSIECIGLSVPSRSARRQVAPISLCGRLILKYPKT